MKVCVHAHSASFLGLSYHALELTIDCARIYLTPGKKAIIPDSADSTTLSWPQAAPSTSSQPKSTRSNVQRLRPTSNITPPDILADTFTWLIGSHNHTDTSPGARSAGSPAGPEANELPPHTTIDTKYSVAHREELTQKDIRGRHISYLLLLRVCAQLLTTFFATDGHRQ